MIDATQRCDPRELRLRMIGLPLRQQDIADRVGVSRRTVIRVMCGQTEIPYPLEVCFALLCDEFDNHG